jgi:hypothetical protein
LRIAFGEIADLPVASQELNISGDSHPNCDYRDNVFSTLDSPNIYFYMSSRLFARDYYSFITKFKGLDFLSKKFYN